MDQVILVIHMLLAIALICVVLLQKSEGGGLGIGGGGGMSGLMSGRGTANLLTRTTAILAFCFMVTSLALAWLATGAAGPRSILETAPAPAMQQEAPPAEPVAPPAAPEPSEPGVPLAQ